MCVHMCVYIYIQAQGYLLKVPLCFTGVSVSVITHFECLGISQWERLECRGLGVLAQANSSLLVTVL